MPKYAKRKYRRGRRRRRTRYGRKKRRRSFRKRPTSNGMRCKLQSVSTVTFNSGPDTINNYFWSLDEMPDYQKYTAVFQYYRIKAVKMTFWPTYNSYMKWEQTDGSTQIPRPTLPRIAYIKNREGKTIESLINTQTLAGMLENTKAKCIMIPTEKPISIMLKPNCLGRVAEGVQTEGTDKGHLYPSTSDNTVKEYDQWYSTSTGMDQIHYGLAVLFNTPGVDTDNQFQIYQRITLYVEFKGNRVQS